MNFLSSVCSLDPFIKEECHTEILTRPTREMFQLGQPYEFRVKSASPGAVPRTYIVQKHSLTVFWCRKYTSIRVYDLIDAPHDEGLPILAAAANAEVLGTMKQLGMFGLAERILDAQSAAFPDFLS